MAVPPQHFHTISATPTDLRGFAADDLHGAFKEAQAISLGTKCNQYLFSLSLNPPETAEVGVEQFETAIGRIESKLGFEGLPRAVVFHEKEGRRHAHCVWSRIDAETMTARPVPFFKTKLRDISRDLYLEHGWRMPHGLANRDQRNPLNFTLAEWQQAKRSGNDPRTIKSAIQDAWAISDGKASFEHALNERGFWLAKGDRRGFVAVDYQGKVYSIARAIGKKAKEVRERLGSEFALKPVAQVKANIATGMTEKLRDHVSEVKSRFRPQQESLDFARQEMVQRQRNEREALLDLQDERAKDGVLVLQKRLPRGLKGLWSRVTGQYGKLKSEIEDERKHVAKRDRSERAKLLHIHHAERRTLQRSIKMERSAQADVLRDLRRDIHRYISLGREGPDRMPSRRRTGRNLDR